MAKSEYHEPALVPGERAVPSIKIDASAIHALLIRAEVMMTAVDRRRYCDRAIKAIQNVIQDFTMAYDFEEERLYYLKKMWADIAVFLDLMRMIGQMNCIRIFPKHETMTPDMMKIELFNRVASLDEGATKWKKTVYRSKGKTPTIG